MNAYKYWRVSNILSSGVSGLLISCGQLNFINSEGVPSNVPSKAFAYSYNSGFEPSKAFDSNPATWTAWDKYSSGSVIVYYLGYEFESPVTVTSVGYAPPLNVPFSQIWSEFIVEGSDDKLVWNTVGACKTTATGQDRTYKEYGVLPLVSPVGGAHRYWRVTDVVTRDSFPNIAVNWQAGNVEFKARQVVPCVVPENGFAPNWKIGSPAHKFLPARAFDGWNEYYDSNGFLAGAARPADTNTVSWWLAYDFKYPVQVTAVIVGMSKESSGHQTGHDGEDWVSAKVEWSDDAISWFSEGFGVFEFPTGSNHQKPTILSLLHPSKTPSSIPTLVYTATSPPNPLKNLKRVSYSLRFEAIGAPNFVSFNNPSSGGVAEFNSFGRGGRGYISGVIYEKVEGTTRKVPVSRQVYLIHQLSGARLGTTFSDEKGVYLFRKVALGVNFIIVSVDHTGKWGVEGAGFRQAREVVFDGLLVQYPHN